MSDNGMRVPCFEPAALRGLVCASLREAVERYKRFNDALEWHQHHCRGRCERSCPCDCHR